MIGKSLGYQAHKSIVDAMMWCINNALVVAGSWRTVRKTQVDLPTDKPMIIVSNHQSMFDIPTIGWVLRKHHPKYIAKATLAKGIPSISYNIREGGSITIDRKNKSDAVERIRQFCTYLNQHNRAGCIFPEGTRSRDGKMKPFQKGGLATMLELMPEATIVPVALERYWKITRYKFAPIPFGIVLRCTVFDPIDRAEKSVEELIAELESFIKTKAV